MKNKIIPTIVLTCICLAVALMLSVVNMITAPIIADAQAKKDQAAIEEILPGGGAATSIYEELRTAEVDIPASITDVLYLDAVGYVVKLEVTGKSSGMAILVGIDCDGKVTGTECTKNSETPGYAKPVFELTEGKGGAYIGMSAGSFSPTLVSGSTLTSEAYAGAVKCALDFVAGMQDGQ